MLNIQTFLNGKNTNLKWRFTKYYTGVEESPNIKEMHIRQEEKDEKECETRPRDLDSIKRYCEEWVHSHVSYQFEFRQYQLDYIVGILHNILNDNVKITCVEAPTGSGKSWIAFVIAGVAWEYYRKTSYILVSDLGLQQQYFEDVEKYNLHDFGRMKGLDNYRCSDNGLPFPSGRCKLEKVGYNILMDDERATEHGFPCAATCQILLDRKRAMVSPVTIMTYVLFLTHLNDVAPKVMNSWPPFDKRDIVICDEVHKMPDIVQSWCSPTFDIENDIKQFRVIRDYIFATKMFDKNEETELEYSPSNIRKSQYAIVDAPTKEKSLEALKEYVSYQEKFALVAERIKNRLTEKQQKGEEFDQDDKRVIFACDWLGTRHPRFKGYPDIVKNVGIDKMVINSNYDSKERTFDKKVFTINCVYEEWLVQKFFNSNCRNEVMMSATLGDPVLFRRSVGIETWDGEEYKERNYRFGRIPSTFNFDKSPIYVIPNYKLTYSLKEQNLPFIVRLAEQIINAHKGQRGIIHTGSYEFSKKLMEGLPPETGNRVIYYTSSKNKNEALQLYQKRSDAIIAGPTLVEGVNLPDDLCRFMIVMKVPYPSLADQLVKAKKDFIPDWYIGTTIKSMIQSFGRGIRHKDDWCITYIIDGSFCSIFKQGGSMLAPELVNRVKFISA